MTTSTIVDDATCPGSGSQFNPLPRLADIHDRRELLSLIEEAVASINREGLGGTPLVHRATPFGRVGLKLESQSKVGAYKLRGVFFGVNEALARGAKSFATASTGNNARAAVLATHGTGARLDIFVPAKTEDIKLAALIAEHVVLWKVDGPFDDAQAACKAYAVQVGAVVLAPYNSHAMILGNATIGWEVLRGGLCKTLFVPVGGGGLIAGIAKANFALGSPARVIGVCSDHAPAAALSFRNGHLVSVPATPGIAGGVLVGTPGDICFPIVRKLVDDFITVSETQVELAMAVLTSWGIQAEGAGAVSLAGLMQCRDGVPAPVCIVSGGNISAELQMTTFSKMSETTEYISWKAGEINV